VVGVFVPSRHPELASAETGYPDSCDDDCPVTEVSWYEPVQLANALSIKEKLSPG
jgi:hypothetical protein